MERIERRRLEAWLAAYAVAAGAHAAQAAVVNVDPPDVVLDTATMPGSLTTLDLDLDCDGAADFTIELHKSRGLNELGVQGRGGNAVAEASSYYAAALGSGIPVPGGAGYMYSRVLMASASETKNNGWKLFGEWRNARDRFLAVQFDSAGATHYGWVRLSVETDAATGRIRLTLHDWAYEDSPHTSIDTGDTGGGPHYLGCGLPATGAGSGGGAGAGSGSSGTGGSTGSGTGSSGGGSGSSGTGSGSSGTGSGGSNTGASGGGSPGSGTSGAAGSGAPQPIHLGISSSGSGGGGGGCAIGAPQGDPLALAPLGALALGAVGVRLHKRRRARLQSGRA